MGDVLVGLAILSLFIFWSLTFFAFLFVSSLLFILFKRLFVRDGKIVIHLLLESILIGIIYFSPSLLFLITRSYRSHISTLSTSALIGFVIFICGIVFFNYTNYFFVKILPKNKLLKNLSFLIFLIFLIVFIASFISIYFETNIFLNIELVYLIYFISMPISAFLLLFFLRFREVLN